MRNGAVVDLDGGLVVFGDEDGFVGTVDFTNPDVVVVVGVFYDLNIFPRTSFGIVGLLSDGSQAVAVVPSVKFTVGGVGFGNTVAFVIVGVRPNAVTG